MRLKHYIIIAMLTVMTLITMVFCYWNLEGVMFHKVFDTNEILFHTTKLVYHQGDTVQATFSVCKNTDITPVVQWSIIDTYLRTYPSRKGTQIKHGCVINKMIDIQLIADTLPNDTYYFSGTAVYRLNPIKTVVISLKTNTFVVK